MSIKTITIIILSLLSALLLYDDLSLRAEKHLLTQQLLRYEMESRRGEQRGNRGVVKGASINKLSPHQDDALLEQDVPFDSVKSSSAKSAMVVPVSKDCSDADCQQRAKELAQQMMDEKQATAEAQQDEQMRNKINEFADEQKWTEAFTQSIMDFVFNSIDDHRALREEFRSEQTPKKERRVQMMDLMASFEEDAGNKVPPNELEAFLDMLPPPYHRKPK